VPDPDELPRVTPALLRRADTMCRRRLAHEHRGGKGWANRSGNGRFAVSGRISGDARLAQSELGPPRPEAFVDPNELEPEQRRVYRAAAQGYLAAFGHQEGLIVDLGWSTALPDLGVQLVAPVGLPVELADGRRELRLLAFGARRRALLDPVDLKVALVRTASWAPDQLKIVGADLLEHEVVEHEPALPHDRDLAFEWLAERVRAVTEHAADGRARPGADCQGCAFVAGCAAHGG
jgi:hypothetical protein